MTLRWIGALLVVSACTGVGYGQSASHRRKEHMLSQLSGALVFMESELQYRMTPLPELFEKTGNSTGGAIGNIFSTLSEALEQQISPDAGSCLTDVLRNNPQRPKEVQRVPRELGRTLGCFDLSGQLKGLALCRCQCTQALEYLRTNRDQRLRSYQMLGLCAGSALAILLL